MTPRVTQWFVYHYRRADGRVFYVGKGGRDRASDISPSRRNPYFLRIIRKDGRDNITIDLFPCATHAEAVALECSDIQKYRQLSDCLTNQTDGGDGCTGRAMTEKMRAAFAPWHGSFHRLSPSAQENIRQGLAVGRMKARAWKQSTEGVLHLEALGQAGRILLHQERSLVCMHCHETFITHSAKAKMCSSRCWQRHRRSVGTVYPSPKRVCA